MPHACQTRGCLPTVTRCAAECSLAGRREDAPGGAGCTILGRMSHPSAGLPVRPRRLRLRPELRRMLQRVSLRRSDVIVPVFVTGGKGVRKEVGSMPGVFQM